MDKFGATIMESVTKAEFGLILEKTKKDEILLKILEELVEYGESAIRVNMNPDLIVRVSILKEQMEIIKNIRILIQDIINLDWNKEETILEFRSMANCFTKMMERNEELAIIGGLK